MSREPQTQWCFPASFYSVCPNRWIQAAHTLTLTHTHTLTDTHNTVTVTSAAADAAPVRHGSQGWNELTDKRASFDGVRRAHVPLRSVDARARVVVRACLVERLDYLDGEWYEKKTRTRCARSHGRTVPPWTSAHIPLILSRVTFTRTFGTRMSLRNQHGLVPLSVHHIIGHIV